MQITHVSDVQNVEHTIREHELLAHITQTRSLVQQLLLRQNLFRHWRQTQIVRARIINGKSVWSINRLPFTIHGFMTVPFIEDNDQTQARREHLEALRVLVGNVYPNKFERSNVTDTTAGEDTITSVVSSFKRMEPKVPEGQKPSADELDLSNSELNQIRVRIAGRLAAPPRVMGKAAFVHISDGISRLQIYVRKADVKAVNNDTLSLMEEEGKGWELFGLLDHGDFVGVGGYLFVTKTGELSVHVEKLQFLSKAW